MAYIGKQPAKGNFVKLDTITTSATTTFNLLNGGVAYFPQSANNCLVSLNGILQAPTDSYTISGSTIIFSNALTTSDVIDFIIVLGDVLNIGTPSDNTVSLAKLTATGTKNSTTFLRGDNTFAVPAGGVNTPAFYAYRTSIQSISNGTAVKVQLPTELFDTNNCFDNATNYRFTPTTAGKYFLYGQAQANSGTDYEGFGIYIRKNGTDISETNGRNEFYQTLNSSVISSANGTTDYFEFFVYHDSSPSQDIGGAVSKTFFMGYKIIE